MFSVYPYEIEELETKAILANYIIRDNTSELSVCNSVSKQASEIVIAIFSNLFKDIKLFSEDANKILTKNIEFKLQNKAFKLI